LTELYSLFRFLNPTMFGSLDDFNASYTNPIQRFGDKDASESLRRKIFPFILRRLKKDVLNDLPDRIDQTIYVEMSEKQKRLYNERRQSYRVQINEIIARDGIQKSQFVMFQALNELRRIASVPESVSDGMVASPKIDELVESLIASAGNGHKSVVFFNFIAGLEIVMERLEKIGIQYETMTGSTSAGARKKVVERFQSDPSCMVILLTLKVGGVGLNLTAADTVYIFEPWWNKAAEQQAINRLHRIGQKKTVTSYSIITMGTIEEKMLQLQAQKSELFNELISADTASTKTLTQKDIDFILS
ncbi:MAG: DEAD/DEAH box helicase, partial [Muribaculaceae bacterium]|nr:DEAD/DEAH box helicase [Muribaculaceae bacterium]